MIAIREVFFPEDTLAIANNDNIDELTANEQVEQANIMHINIDVCE